MIKTRRLAATVCGALLVSSSAIAADTVIVLEGLEGDLPNAARTIDVQSWSWGASNAGIVSPRDVSSGLPTGKRIAAPAGTGGTASAANASAAAVRDVNVTLPEAAAKSACATGKHIKSVKLTARSENVQLDDVVVTSCTTNAGVSTLALRGQQKTGHVTVLK